MHKENDKIRSKRKKLVAEAYFRFFFFFFLGYYMIPRTNRRSNTYMAPYQGKEKERAL